MFWFYSEVCLIIHTWAFGDPEFYVATFYGLNTSFPESLKVCTDSGLKCQLMLEKSYVYECYQRQVIYAIFLDTRENAWTVHYFKEFCCTYKISATMKYVSIEPEGNKGQKAIRKSSEDQ